MGKNFSNKIKKYVDIWLYFKCRLMKTLCNATGEKLNFRGESKNSHVYVDLIVFIRTKFHFFNKWVTLLRQNIYEYLWSFLPNLRLKFTEVRIHNELWYITTIWRFLTTDSAKADKSRQFLLTIPMNIIIYNVYYIGT